VAKPFDATLNALIDAHLAEWAAFLATRVGVPLSGPVHAIDTDLSSTLQADRLFRVDGPTPYILHLELESTGRLGIPDELLSYNAAAYTRTPLPIHSVLVLLRPKANATDQTGTLVRLGADGQPYHTFRYHVVRVWEETVADLLTAGPGLAPLALLTNEASLNLDGAFERFRERLRQPDVPRSMAEELFNETFVLSGLRYNRTRMIELYRRLNMTLEESDTYQWILEQGEAKGKALTLRRNVLVLGEKRFGPPPATITQAVQAMTDHDRLDRIISRVFDATSWDDLLTTP
jgi:hypothetical protein